MRVESFPVIAIDKEAKLKAANAVLAIIAHETRLELKGKRVIVEFPYQGLIKRQWQTRGQDFYPVWYSKFGSGGTVTTALSQLVRWIQGKPVLPMGTWRYWTGPVVAMGRENGPSIIEILAQAGYPEQVNCVRCGEPVTAGLDWWSLNGVSGPAHGWKQGCDA